jgi:protein subunit release factor B
MRLEAIGGVSPGKIQELLSRIKRLGMDPGLIEERFIKGGGKGGQKVNKSANCVRLRYQGIEVRCQRERSLAVNRFLALRELTDRMEMRVSPGTSERLREVERIRRRKARRRRKAAAIKAIMP